MPAARKKRALRWAWMSIFVLTLGCNRNNHTADADSDLPRATDRSLQRARGKTLEIFSAALGKGGEHDCYDYNGQCVLLPKEPSLSITNFDYRLLRSRKPGIEIHLSAEEQAQIAALTGSLINRRIAIAHQGRILHVAKVRSKIKQDALVVTFCNPNNYHRVVQSLRY